MFSGLMISSALPSRASSGSKAAFHLTAAITAKVSHLFPWNRIIQYLTYFHLTSTMECFKGEKSKNPGRPGLSLLDSNLERIGLGIRFCGENRLSLFDAGQCSARSLNRPAHAVSGQIQLF